MLVKLRRSSTLVSATLVALALGSPRGTRAGFSSAANNRSYTRNNWSSTVARYILSSTSDISMLSASDASLNSSFKLVMSPRLHLVHIREPVKSTQDEARRLIQEDNDLLPYATSWRSEGKCLAVLADAQTAGRGTQGRTWESGKGNLYLTVAIPMDKIPVRITLLPLQVGVLVAQRVATVLDACGHGEGDSIGVNGNDQTARNRPKTTVKWPNDVLVNELKVSGTLIENFISGVDVWMLIGIGVNIGFAPSLANSSGKQARGSTSVQEHCRGENDVKALPELTSAVFGTDLASALVDWVYDTSNDRSTMEARVIQEWESFAEFGKFYELRGRVVDESDGGYQGERVVSVGIQFDGQLRVRGENGKERLLIADYMF